MFLVHGIKIVLDDLRNRLLGVYGVWDVCSTGLLPNDGRFLFLNRNRSDIFYTTLYNGI